MIDREACIVLNLIPGVGFVKYSALSREFGSPAGVFGRSSGELRRIPGIGEQLGERIASFDWEGSLNRETELAERAGVRIITLFDDAYPEVLRQLPDPPLCLYVRGRLPAFPDHAVAIVGSRRMSAYGERMTRSIAADAAAAGFTVVSGLAYGVDAIAHRTVVDAAGITVAVLGGGLMNVHPRENIPLARAIVASGGAIISEFPLEFPVSRTSFPRRNRIVAGLCRGTIVVEAGLESGALITARLALEGSRDVFAVPGHADNPQAHGCHRLIREGAVLIENFDDVLNEFNSGLLPGFQSLPIEVGEAARSAGGYRPDSSGDLPPEQARLLELLAAGEMGLDALREATGMETGALLAALMRLELKLLVERGTDQLYRLTSSPTR